MTVALVEGGRTIVLEKVSTVKNVREGVVSIMGSPQRNSCAPENDFFPRKNSSCDFLVLRYG